jgi:hypothetical protein
MTTLTHRPASAGPSRVRLEPVQHHRVMLAGTWWPRTSDPATELPPLLSALDGFRGPVVRVLLSAVGWKRRPHHVVVAGRSVGLGYFSDQPPTLLTAICADGAVFTLLVVPPEPAGPGRAGDEDAWENEGGHLAAPHGAVR